jgi:O-antigen biosynthesis protein
MEQPPCYCITGHGRSGTSMIAAMLQSGGLHIGSRLMGPYEGNPRGHFEDMDFYEFHVAVLTAQELGSEGYELQPTVPVPEQFVPAARALIEARRLTGRSWGWKDPRTTLFLDFWRGLVPEARFLLLFRAPWEVVDSMFRRGDAVFQRKPSHAVMVWLNYNRALIDFHDRFPEQCLLVEGHAAAVAPHCLTEAIAAKFGDHFGPLEDLFDKTLFQDNATSHRRSVLGHFFPESLEMYAELRKRARLVHGEAEAAVLPGPGLASKDWALQDWVDFRGMEKKWKHVQAELECARSEVSRLQGEIQQFIATQDRSGLDEKT